MSVRTVPFQILLKDENEKSLGFNFMDTPGHPDFFDEVCASVRLCDNVLLLVDVLDGITLHLEKLIQVTVY